MKSLIFALLLSLGIGANGYECYNYCPPPVVAYSGSASQACPFDGWDLNTLYTYASCYYQDLANTSYYMYYYYGYSASYVKWWLHGCMCETWMNAYHRTVNQLVLS